MLRIIGRHASRSCILCNGNISAKLSKIFLSKKLVYNFSLNRNSVRSFYILSNTCLFNSTHRVLAAADDYHFPIEKSNELSYFWEDYTKKISFKRRCINRVSTIFDCNENEARDIVGEHPMLFLENIDNTFDNVQLLQRNGVLSNILKRNIWLLYYDHDDLINRIDLVHRWNVDDCSLSCLLPLFKLSPNDFNKISDVFIAERDTMPHGNRIVYLAKTLDVPVEKLVMKLVRHKYLLVRNMDLILDSIRSYKEFGINEKELVEDIWSLRYSEFIIRKRLKIVKENDFPQMKAWYVRCSEENFEKMIEANKVEKLVMHPFKTREEFLAHKFEIDLHTMSNAMEKYSIFKKIHIKKLVNMIDFLKKTGFSSLEICSCCRIFHFSLETTMERINELRNLRVQSMSISMLIKNQSEYRKLIERIEYIRSIQENSVNNK